MAGKPATADRSDLLRRVGEMRTERASWMAHWAELSRCFLPRNGRFFLQDRNRGHRRHNAIYDNTGTRAVRVLAAGLQSGMTSPARPWLRLATPDPKLNGSHAVKVWLDDVTRVMLAIFRKSTFYQALHQGYGELAVFGTDAMVFQDNFDNVMHLGNLTAGEYCIATDWFGRVNTLVREFERPVAEVVQHFGYENCSTTVRSLYDHGTLGAWIPITHIIEPRADRDPRSKLAKDMPWRSVYFERGAGPEFTLRDGGMREFRVVCSRWDVAGGDIYGNSPAMEALGDVKQLQQQQLRKGQGIDYMTRPALALPPSMKNSDADLLPGGQNYTDGAEQVRPMWLPNLRLDHLLEDMRDVRERVKASFYVDMFLMLSEMGEARMTATEVAERHQEKLLMLGPTSERQHDEKLTPVVELTFARMLDAGLVPPPPPELHGVDLNVEFVSTIAQAQREIGLNGVDRYVGNLGQIAAFAPGVLDRFDADKWAEIYADRLGVDAELVVPSETVALIRKNRAQAQAQAAQTQQAEQQAKTMQALGNTPIDGALASLVAGGGLVQTDNPMIR